MCNVWGGWGSRVGNSERSLTLWEDLPMKICLQSGVNQIDNKCLRICEPYGVCSPPFYLMQLSLVFSLSAYSMGCHTAAAAVAARANDGGGKMLGCSALLWQLVLKEHLVQGVQSRLKLCSARTLKYKCPG